MHIQQERLILLCIFIRNITRLPCACQDTCTAVEDHSNKLAGTTSQHSLTHTHTLTTGDEGTIHPVFLASAGITKYLQKRERRETVNKNHTI